YRKYDQLSGPARLSRWTDDSYGLHDCLHDIARPQAYRCRRRNWSYRNACAHAGTCARRLDHGRVELAVAVLHKSIAGTHYRRVAATAHALRQRALECRTGG